MNTHSPALARVEKGDLCSGCGLCKAAAAPGAIEMRLSDEGYLRPFTKRPLSKEDDRLIETICPGLNLEQQPPRTESPHHTIWGPIKSVYTGHAQDPDLRYQGSSGGALSAFLIYLLQSGSVDFVVQNCVSDDSPLLNAVRNSTTRDDVIRSAGSRYAPSAPLEMLREQLAGPGRFAFVGKPCDVAALRAYVATDPSIKERIPFMLSFMCGGIPSQHGTKQILKRLDVSADAVTSFRYRGNGWPGFATAVTQGGQEAKMSYAEAWGDILSKHVQLRCKICPDGTGGFADLICADAWYGDEKGYPKFDEADGRSLIIVRTETGQALFNAATAAGMVEAEPLAEGEIIKMQPYQARRKMLVLSRIAAMKLFGRVVPSFRNLDLWKAARQTNLLSQGKSFLGTSRRVLLKKL